MKIGAIASLASTTPVFQALIAACSWSRALMVVAACWLRPIEGDPVADHFQQPPALRMLVALGLGALFTFVTLGPYTALSLATAQVPAFLSRLSAAPIRFAVITALCWARFNKWLNCWFWA